jgi:hypothetical protein
VSRKIVTIGEEVFDFLAWKLPKDSFYARRSDGELRVVVLVGSRLSLRATRFRCEVDGITVPFESYQLLPLSLSEIPQLQNVLQESAYSPKSKPAEKRGKTTPALSATRAAAARKGAKVTDRDDLAKIKKEFFRRTNGGQSNNAAASGTAELISDDDNRLELRSGPYDVSRDTVKRIAGVK